MEPPVIHVVYQPPARRGNGPGRLAQDIQFAHFRLEWKNENFILVVAEWREGYNTRSYTAVLRRGGADAELVINSLMIAAATYSLEPREEILVFNDGYVLAFCGLSIINGMLSPQCLEQRSRFMG